MTALTAGVPTSDSARLRPLPWRRMAWITWRQHRVAMIGVTVFLGALALWLWLVGRQLHHAYAAGFACRPAGSIACGDLVSRFNGMDKILWYGYVLQALPALIGAFVGAPTLARELETGTFRYAWTQGFGRSRWALAKLVMLASALAVAAGAVSALFAWYYRPYFAAGNRALSLSQWSPLSGSLFDLRGIAFVAWTVAAFALGVLAGMLVRRVVPAIVATLVVYTGLAAVAALLRPHYLAPFITSRLDLSASALITRQWWTHDARFAFGGRPPIEVLQHFCTPSAIGPGKPTITGLAHCLSQHGYTRWTSYQPATRFWSFQLIEAGWLLALSLLLITVTVALVRRRAS